MLSRWILVWITLLAAGVRLPAASSAENRAFKAAEDFFAGTFYEKAEAEFADFVRKFPESSRRPEAVLFQAEARLQQTNYGGAIELLWSSISAAGSWADQYQFWLGKAYFGRGNYLSAAEAFEKLVKDYPSSPWRLEAGIEQATALARLPDWPRVVELLQLPNGVFQCAVRTNAASEWVFRGYLLFSEAQLAQQNYSAAEATLQPLAKLLLSPKSAWQWQYLLCRIQLAEGRVEEALQNTTNLLFLASSTAQPDLQGDSAAFRAAILERLGRQDEAIAAYRSNLADAIPAERQRQALLKITELSLAQNKTTNAIEMLGRFVGQFPQAASADLAWLTLGELSLREHLARMNTNGFPNASTNASAATNYLGKALDAFTALTQNFPQSPFVGKGQLGLGWCFWLQEKMPESLKAFQAAVERLPLSVDQAYARFKLADAQFRLKDFAGAVTNYNAIVEKFAALQEVKTNLFEPALYQALRASLAANDLAAATSALAKLLAWYPKSFVTGGAVLLTGQQISRQGDPAGAREMFLAFVKSAPDAPMRPEVELAIARTYEQEKKWPQAIQQYEDWLACFTNHPARPRAEYFRAWANFQADNDTNALTLFTNFVAQSPPNDFTQLAQWWVADYYLATGNPQKAEENYQLLYKSTNWPPSRLTYQAQIMAGRAAVLRQGWKDAIGYFTNLTSDLNCPTDLWVQAMFDYGDTLMRQDSTNKLADYEEAIRVFSKICESFPTNQLAARAWGEKANCLLQWARSSRDFEPAAKAFQEVLAAAGADVTARSMAKVGLAVVLEKQAQQKTGAEQSALLESALDHYVDVFYGKTVLRGDDDQPDLFWTKKAGLEAGRLAEALQRWSQALSVYQRLTNLLPSVSATLESRIQNAEKNLRLTR